MPRSPNAPAALFAPLALPCGAVLKNRVVASAVME